MNMRTEVKRRCEDGEMRWFPCCDTGMRSGGEAHDNDCDYINASVSFTLKRTSIPLVIGLTCEYCRNWNRASLTEGQCRAHPPQVAQKFIQLMDVSKSDPFPIWPTTQAVDWCGEFVHK